MCRHAAGMLVSLPSMKCSCLPPEPLSVTLIVMLQTGSRSSAALSLYSETSTWTSGNIMQAFCTCAGS